MSEKEMSFAERIRQALREGNHWVPEIDEDLPHAVERALSKATERDLPVLHKTRCLECDSNRCELIEVSGHFEWGVQEKHRIPFTEPIFECQACGFRWGDERSERARDLAVVRYFSEKGYVFLWLDDVREAPEGWVHVKTVEEAKAYLEKGNVFRASLDHDLGDDAHNGTGYALVCWMEESGHWPKYPPQVHSANPVGAQKMRTVINKQYGLPR